jgi:hypothetical protein
MPTGPKPMLIPWFLWEFIMLVVGCSTYVVAGVDGYVVADWILNLLP